MKRKWDAFMSTTHSWLDSLPTVPSDFTDPSIACSSLRRRRASQPRSARTTLGIISPNRMPSSSPIKDLWPSKHPPKLHDRPQAHSKIPTAHPMRTCMPLAPQVLSLLPAKPFLKNILHADRRDSRRAENIRRTTMGFGSEPKRTMAGCGEVQVSPGWDQGCNSSR